MERRGYGDNGNTPHLHRGNLGSTPSISTITKQCLECGKAFEAPLKEHNRGNAKYCNLACSRRRGCRVSSERARRKRVELSCTFCNATFTRAVGKLSKSKHANYFCSRKCKDMSQRLDNSRDYRDRAFRNKKPKCERCGYSKNKKALHVHHKDRDRGNNRLNNLEILCLNCHTEEHCSD